MIAIIAGEAPLYGTLFMSIFAMDLIMLVAISPVAPAIATLTVPGAFFA